MKATLRFFVTGSIVTTATALAALGGADIDLSWRTVDGGGVMESTGGDLELSGTIGQPDAGALSGGDFTLTGGFWFALAPDDCNSDGGVNLIDYDDFEGCLSGPDIAVTPVCTCFDVDQDDDVDLLDVAQFQKAFNGG